MPALPCLADPSGIQELKDWLVASAVQQHAATTAAQAAAAAAAKPFLFSIDHCFLLKGQGTILTGTVLQVGVANRSRLAC